MALLKRVFVRYFSSGWIPVALALLFLAAAGALEFAGPYRFARLSGAFAVAFLVALLGVLCAALWNFLQKRWRTGFLNLLGLPVCFVALLAASFACMFGQPEDGFADDLAIPAGLEISGPLPAKEPHPGAAPDTFQSSILGALDVEGLDDTKVTAAAPSLVKLAGEHPDLLRRHLASSAGWRVYEDRGKRFATRRWKIGGRWQWTLHGYYSRHDTERWNEDKKPGFQTRITLGLDGKPWFENAATTRVKHGDTRPLEMRRDNGRDTSHCVIQSYSVAVEIFEESEGRERRLTKASLAELEKEIAPLAANPDWNTVRALLPAGSITQGPPSLELHDGSQGGIYDATIRVNPGEPGHVYLKAFEVTKGAPLSGRRLEQDSTEWVGWSENPDEQFLSNSQIMIGEGDWGQYYAARFEVWFVPDSGAPERKLLERNFKIEGWQR